MGLTRYATPRRLFQVPTGRTTSVILRPGALYAIVEGAGTARMMRIRAYGYQLNVPRSELEPVAQGELGVAGDAAAAR